MYFIIVIIIPVCLGVLIAYSISQIGKKKQIGFAWTFYFSVLNPLMGIVLSLLSRSHDPIKAKLSTFKKFSSILLIIIGLIYVLGGLTTSKETPPIDVSALQIRGVNTGNHQTDLIINDTAKSLGGVLTCGISEIPLSLELIKSTDFRYMAYRKIYIGILILSLGFYIQSKKNSISGHLE